MTDKPLTEKQLGLLVQLANGWTLKECAHARGVSARSVSSMVYTMYRKLDAVTIPNLVHIAWQKGILK